MSLPIAHASHWLVNILYIAPVLIVVAVLGFRSIMDRRALKRVGGDVRRPPAEG